MNKKPLTPQEQWERYKAMMAHYERERAKYERGERDTLPPRPIPPHTPGGR